MRPNSQKMARKRPLRKRHLRKRPLRKRHLRKRHLGKRHLGKRPLDDTAEDFKLSRSTSGSAEAASWLDRSITGSAGSHCSGGLNGGPATIKNEQESAVSQFHQ
ncbi:unnamed protein product [Arctogadus glacialis]